MHNAASGMDGNQMHDILQSIVTLTEQRDQRSLEQSMLNTLQGMLPGLAYQVLVTSPTDEHEVVHASQPAGELPQAVLKQCLKGRNQEGISQLASTGFTYLLLDLAPNTQGPARMLLLWRQAWDAGDVRLVQQA